MISRDSSSFQKKFFTSFEMTDLTLSEILDISLLELDPQRKQKALQSFYMNAYTKFRDENETLRTKVKKLKEKLKKTKDMLNHSEEHSNAFFQDCHCGESTCTVCDVECVKCGKWMCSKCASGKTFRDAVCKKCSEFF